MALISLRILAQRFKTRELFRYNPLKVFYFYQPLKHKFFHLKDHLYFFKHSKYNEQSRIFYCLLYDENLKIVLYYEPI